MTQYLIISGSTRGRGRSAALSEALLYEFESLISTAQKTGDTKVVPAGFSHEIGPDDEVSFVSLANVNIAPCMGCDTCAETVPGRDLWYCIISDGMSRLRALLNECDELILVSPVYFAGVPAQTKSLLDRLQPYYHHGSPVSGKRPAHLFVVGEGGDPHGFVPAVATVRSALAVAGFTLKDVHDWVGIIDADGALQFSGDIFQGGTVHSAQEYYCVAPDEVYPRSLRAENECCAV